MFIAGLISIIVPIYNVADYLDECVFSLVNQTYKNIEIILIDDGSTDASGTMCDKWKRLDKRIKVIHTNNYGVSHARNVGLGAITGNYVSFVDADDWVESDYYELLLREMVENRTDVSGGGYTREEITGGVVTLRKEHHKVFSREAILQEIFSCKASKLLYWELCDKLFKKELVTTVRFDEHIANMEDMLFFWQVMTRAKSFAYAPLFKYHYRMREGSAVHSHISPKKFSGDKAMKRVWELAQSENDNLRKTIFCRYISTLAETTRQMLVYDAEYYSDDIKNNQIIIRSNMMKYMRSSQLSLRLVKVSIFLMYLCMPFYVCCYLKMLIKRKCD